MEGLSQRETEVLELVGHHLSSPGDSAKRHGPVPEDTDRA
jgi:hypothetical protein